MSPLEESYRAGVLFGRKAALSEIIDLLTENLYSVEKQRLKELGMVDGHAEEVRMNSEKLEGVMQGILWAMKIVDDDSIAISSQSLKQQRKAILDSLEKVAKTVGEEDNA